MATVKVNLGQFEVYIVNALSTGGILPKMKVLLSSGDSVYRFS